jgi:hypothetical protein
LLGQENIDLLPIDTTRRHAPVITPVASDEFLVVAERRLGNTRSVLTYLIDTDCQLLEGPVEIHSSQGALRVESAIRVPTSDIFVSWTDGLNFPQQKAFCRLLGID